MQADILNATMKLNRATRRVLELSEGVKPYDYKHPNYRALQTAIRVFKREDGRLKRLKSYYAGQAALEEEERA